MFLFHAILIQGKYHYFPNLSSSVDEISFFSHDILFFFCRLSKGFAFIKFTCKKDAENVLFVFIKRLELCGSLIDINYSFFILLFQAIQKLNGQMFGKRTIAVDWAVPKKLYNSGATAVIASEDGN
jgi:RNA recognition motif-containing protein